MKVICAGWGRTGTRSLKYALEYSSMYNVRIISYAKDCGLSDGGIVNEGFISPIKF